MRTAPPSKLEAARRALRRLEESWWSVAAGEPPEQGSLAAPPPDEAPRLGPGAHEWFASDADGVDAPPLAVLIDLARRHAGETRCVAWIGRRCWPHPHALVRRVPEGEADHRLLQRSIFVDPPSRNESLWAADAALRRGALVVADASGLTMPASRRLQLAAASGRTHALLARPPGDRRSLSAARTRWLVRPAAEERDAPTWTVQLVRCKGVQPGIGRARRWVAQRDHATGAITKWQARDVGVAPELDHGRAPAPDPSATRRTA